MDESKYETPNIGMGRTDAGVSDYWKKDFTKKKKPKPKKTKLAGAGKRKRPPVSEFHGFTPIKKKKKGSQQKMQKARKR